MSLLGAIASHYVDTPAGASYFDEVMADDPLGYWRLSETSGRDIADSSGNGRHGTSSDEVISVPGLVVGDPDTALQFNRDREIAVPGAGLDSNAFTCEAIINPLQSADILASRWLGTTAANQVWYWQKNSDGSLRLGCRDAAGIAWTRISPPGLFASEVRTHLAVTVGEGQIIFYVDGVAAYTSTGPTTLQSVPTTQLYLGGGVSGSFPYGGVMDEFSYYGTRLSADRLAAHHAAGIAAA